MNSITYERTCTGDEPRSPRVLFSIARIPTILKPRTTACTTTALAGVAHGAACVAHRTRCSADRRRPGGR